MKITALKISASIVAAVLVLSCHKNEIEPATNTSAPGAGQSMKKVPERMYELPDDKVLQTIKNFNAVAAHSTAKLQMPDDTVIPVDSSLWLLEALLNHHFDKKTQEHEIFEETCNIDIPANTIDGANFFVAKNDLVQAYNGLKSAIQQKAIGPKKVKVIDLTAVFDPASQRVYYTASVTLFSKISLPSPCLPVNQSANWSNFFAGTCSGASPNDGPTVCEIKLNNCVLFNGCEVLYYTNVSTVSFYGGTYPSALYFKQASGLMNACQPLLSSNLLNNYVFNCKGLGASNLPGGPTGGFAITNYNITDGAIGGSGMYTLWWQLAVTYGKPVCAGMNPN